MGPEFILLASLSSSGLPRIHVPPTPTQAILQSCDLEDAGDVDQAIRVLRAANDATEIMPLTTIPPEN